MPITWGEAIADADNDDDVALYERAVAQVRELEPLVQSFAEAVMNSGKWPRESPPDYPRPGWVAGPAGLTTRVGWDVRTFWAYWSQPLHWGLSVSKTMLLNVHELGGVPVFGGHRERSTAIAAPDFRDLMAAMDETVEWVPRELVAYLRSNNIPVPRD